MRYFSRRYRFMLWLLPSVAFLIGMGTGVYLVMLLVEETFSGMGSGFVGPT
ncbi:hypothetical protein [Nemorincola caseinilytica]|uniref:hypothetical protein n=1 Tax=Nemorincola caseinilytica TaxID=2054315 RepID=UPI0031F058A0